MAYTLVFFQLAESTSLEDANNVITEKAINPSMTQDAIQNVLDDLVAKMQSGELEDESQLEDFMSEHETAIVSPIVESGLIAPKSEEALIAHLPRPLFKTLFTEEAFSQFNDEDALLIRDWMASESASFPAKFDDPFNFMDLTLREGTLMLPLSTKGGDEDLLQWIMDLATNAELNKHGIYAYDLQLGRILTEEWREDVAIAISQEEEVGPMGSDGAYDKIWEDDVRKCCMTDDKDAIFVHYGEEAPLPVGSIGGLLLAQELMENVSVAMPFIKEKLADNAPSLAEIYSDHYLGLMTADHEKLDGIYDEVVATWWARQDGVAPYASDEMVSAASRLAAALYQGPDYDEPTFYVQRFMLAGAALSLAPEMIKFWEEDEGFGEIVGQIQRAMEFLTNLQEAFGQAFDNEILPKIIVHQD